jgi:hypothetical protein
MLIRLLKNIFYVILSETKDLVFTQVRLREGSLNRLEIRDSSVALLLQNDAKGSE